MVQLLLSQQPPRSQHKETQEKTERREHVEATMLKEVSESPLSVYFGSSSFMTSALSAAKSTRIPFIDTILLYMFILHITHIQKYTTDIIAIQAYC